MAAAVRAIFTTRILCTYLRKLGCPGVWLLGAADRGIVLGKSIIRDSDAMKRWFNVYCGPTYTAERTGR